MIKTSRQLKALVRNLCKGDSTKAQIFIRSFAMERFLERISLSSYQDHFVLKGGMLISAMVGNDIRTTMDMDTTIKNMSLTKGHIVQIVEEIISIELEDGMSFEIKEIRDIMEDAEYSGIRMHMLARLEGMKIPLKVDFSTGDVVVPAEIQYSYKLMFEERTISIWAYSLETVLAEKLETVISRGEMNTRLRDYYDIYILQNTYGQKLDVMDFAEAFRATCTHREVLTVIQDAEHIIREIYESRDMQQMWKQYQQKYAYAKTITWEKVIHSIEMLYQHANVK